MRDAAPYFMLDNVLKGAFGVATKLYGIKFYERKDIQIYQPDVKVYEVKEANGKHLGIFILIIFHAPARTTGMVR